MKKQFGACKGHWFKVVYTLLACTLFSPFAWADDQPTWALKIDLESIFPSMAISTATMDRTKSASKKNETYFGDVLGQIGCEVISPKDNCPFSVEISSSKFIRKTILNGNLPKSGVKYQIYPEIDYDYDALRENIEPTPEMVTVTVALDGQSSQLQKRTVPVRSVHDCLRSISKNGKVVDVSWLFAAYVNENSPLVDKILKEALRLKLVDSFTGYQNGEQEVVKQAFAIWNVLQRLGVRYSSITTPSVESDSQHINAQTIRSLEDSVYGKQANCVDGSVLFASIYRKIGLQPILVLVPGHCFMGIKVDPAGKKRMFIETTMIGLAEQSNKLKTGIETLAAGGKNRQSLASFEAACNVASKRFEECKPQFEKTPGYHLLDIEKVRRLGIQPLSSHKVQ